MVAAPRGTTVNGVCRHRSMWPNRPDNTEVFGGSLLSSRVRPAGGLRPASADAARRNPRRPDAVLTSCGLPRRQAGLPPYPIHRPRPMIGTRRTKTPLTSPPRPSPGRLTSTSRHQRPPSTTSPGPGQGQDRTSTLPLPRPHGISGAPGRPPTADLRRRRSGPFLAFDYHGRG